MAITATAARKDFYRLIEKVNLDHDEIGITSKSGSAFLVSARDYNALRETAKPRIYFVPPRMRLVSPRLRTGSRRSHNTP